MIPSTTEQCQREDWKKALAEAVRQPEELLAALHLEPAQLPELLPNSRDFPLRVPLDYVARMRRGDPHDPLLRQILPLRQEQETPPGFVLDPVGDGPATAHPGLLQKYRGRALLITTGACPIHCRYCFRRHFPYNEAHLGPEQLARALEHIAQDPSLEEIILSGGDPLSLSNERLQRLSDQLAEIPHLKRLRIHSRMPIVLPQRVDEGFVDWLASLPWNTVMVVHANHGNELSPNVRAALGRVRATGTTLLNQAVLLHGVNDSVADLKALSESLFEAGTLPYYLHLLDRVQGAAHFEVAEQQARALLEQLRQQLPGYLVPRLVREQAGAPYKSLADTPAESAAP